MLPRIISYIIFWLLMTVIVLGSILVVVLLYFPFVAIKAVVMAISGKLNPKAESKPIPSPGEV